MNLRAGELWGDTLVAAGKPWRPVFAADKRSYAERMIAAAELGRAFESGVGFRPATPEEKEEARRIAAELIRLADEQDAADAPFQRRMEERKREQDAKMAAIDARLDAALRDGTARGCGELFMRRYDMLTRGDRGAWDGHRKSRTAPY